MKYGDWHIQFDPPPIPTRQLDWHYWHDDFDGAEDAGDNRCGSVPSLEIAMQEIDDYEDEQFDEIGCSHGCPLASYGDCLAAGKCKHRDGARSRKAARSALVAAAREGRDGTARGEARQSGGSDSERNARKDAQ